MQILALDPSGNYEEGKGTTGFIIGDSEGNVLDLGYISASEYSSRFEYWNAIIELVKNYERVVVEDYKLYNHKGMKAQTQSYSQMETPRLLGVIDYICKLKNIKIYWHMASDVKQRWSDEVLVESNILEKKSNKYYYKDKHIIEHTRDALRHYLHYIKYKK